MELADTTEYSSFQQLERSDWLNRKRISSDVFNSQVVWKLQVHICYYRSDIFKNLKFFLKTKIKTSADN